MHDGMPYGRIQGQGQGHSREVDRQSPTGLILFVLVFVSRDFELGRKCVLYKFNLIPDKIDTYAKVDG